MSQLVLIPGGSRGMGAAPALLAARQGHAVAVNSRANSLAAGEVVRPGIMATGALLDVTGGR